MPYEVRDITVREYMTKSSNDDFDFMRKFNHDKPMPMRRMAGFVMRETKGMVYMRCRGEIFSEKTTVCMCCGRPISHPISQYFGVGPVCGSHNYVNPFSSYEELQKTVKEYRENYLHKIIWEGWIPKSAIVRNEPMEL